MLILPYGIIRTRKPCLQGDDNNVLAVGRPGGGVQFHLHATAFNLMLFGGAGPGGVGPPAPPRGFIKPPRNYAASIS